jgi:hypothetical protein
VDEDCLSEGFPTRDDNARSNSETGWKAVDISLRLVSVSITAGFGFFFFFLLHF